MIDFAPLSNWKRDSDHYLRLERMIDNRLRGHYDWRYQNWAKNVACRYGVERVEGMNQGFPKL